jgi:hypothetical protein
MKRVRPVLLAFAIATSACGGGSSSGGGGGGLKAGLYSCDTVMSDSDGSQHFCWEQTLTSTTDQNVKIFKDACDGANRDPNKKGLGFSTTRACSTAEAGCVCRVATATMPPAAQSLERNSYYYFSNMVTDPKNGGSSLGVYQQAIAGRCDEEHGTLSCFGAANLAAGPPAIGADGLPSGWGTYLQCSTTTTDIGTFVCQEQTFPSQPLANLTCAFTNNDGKANFSLTEHCAPPDVPGWSCTFSVKQLGLTGTQTTSNPKWADPANHASLELNFGLARALCKTLSGTLTVYHLNPDGTLPSSGAPDAGTAVDSGAPADVASAGD